MLNELKEALRLINKVQTNPSIGPGERDRLQTAQRELEKVGRSGKLDRRKIFRAVEMIACTLLEVVDERARP